MVEGDWGGGRTDAADYDGDHEPGSEARELDGMEEGH